VRSRISMVSVVWFNLSLVNEKQMSAPYATGRGIYYRMTGGLSEMPSSLQRRLKYSISLSPNTSS
jgi:hypothetical protein